MREVRVAVATILEKTLDSALFYQDKVSLIFKFLFIHSVFTNCFKLHIIRKRAYGWNLVILPHKMHFL